MTGWNSTPPVPPGTFLKLKKRYGWNPDAKMIRDDKFSAFWAFVERGPPPSPPPSRPRRLPDIGPTILDDWIPGSETR